MKEYMVCDIAYSYGISLCKARRYTEEEKKGCADWFKERAFSLISDAPNIELRYISWDDVYKILNERKDDGSFPGCSNSVYIISQDEWNALIELNERKKKEKEKRETEEAIDECKKIIDRCEKQEKLYTKEEAAQKRRAYNRLYNEGGEGYVPHFYTIDEYEWNKTKLNELLKNNC